MSEVGKIIVLLRGRKTHEFPKHLLTWIKQK